MSTAIEKKGYKYTEEFGYIPENWEVKSFNACFTFLGTNTYSRDELALEGKVKNIHYGDILTTYPTILESKNINTFLITPLESKTYSYCRNGDIIIADTAEDNTVGKAVEIQGIAEDEKVIAGLHTMLCRTQKEVAFSKKFLGYFINSSIYHNQLIPLITGIKVSSISKTEIKTTYILRPPLPEQEKIAEVLGDVDELIENTQQLIEKKKNLKIAAMQKLLTPKKDWETKELGSIGFMTAGGTPATNVPKYWNGDINWLQSGAVQNNIIYYGEDLVKKITSSGLKNSAAYLIKKDSVLIALTGATCANIGYLTFPSAANQSVVSLEPYQYNPYFLYQKLLMERNGILSLRGGSAQGGVTLKNLQKYKICIPTDIKIQNKIAAVLFDMDKEIETLEQELAKYKDLKFGMMQELLTGKVRLI